MKRQRIAKTVKNMREFFRQQHGFMSMDIIMMAAVVIAAAVVWHASYAAIDAQHRGAYHVAAGLLVQGCLNEMEYSIRQKAAVSFSETEIVSLNGQDYTIERQMQSDEHGYIIEVKAKWNYGTAKQSEYQTRRIPRP